MNDISAHLLIEVRASLADVQRIIKSGGIKVEHQQLIDRANNAIVSARVHFEALGMTHEAFMQTMHDIANEVFRTVV
jgi:hypothetical protein